MTFEQAVKHLTEDWERNYSTDPQTNDLVEHAYDMLEHGDSEDVKAADAFLAVHG